MKRYWSDLTSAEFETLDPERTVAVLPVGAIEQHGPHLPVSVDTAIANGIVQATERALPADSTTLFLPTLPFGKSDEHSQYPGTVTLSTHTLIDVWREIGASVAAAGVHKFVLLNSHGGQIAPMDVVTRALRIEHGMMAFAVNWFSVGVPENLYDAHELIHGIHGGDMETSVMLALHPDLVNMNAAQNFTTLTQEFAATQRFIGIGGAAARMGWQIQDMNPQGACGNAAAARKEKGDATLAYAGQQLAALLTEIENAPRAWLCDREDATEVKIQTEEGRKR